MTETDKASTDAGNPVEELLVWGTVADPAAIPRPLPAPHPNDGAAPKTGHGRAKAAVSAHNRSTKRRVLEWLLVVLLAVLVAGGLRTYAVQAFYVPSGSMLPTLQLGDRIVVVKFGYTIHRGDIVVFKRPPADTGTADADLVKRVIGLPGETISSVGHTVLIDGKPLKEPWLGPLTGSCAEAAEDIPTTKIPPAHYFVMGDCRGNSADSRTWGTLPASYIVGRVFVIVWRFGHPYFHWF
ncbi:MAG: signal peptidase I [Acidimicrobiales bacterium]|jgi:signal peptidase I